MAKKVMYIKNGSSASMNSKATETTLDFETASTKDYLKTTQDINKPGQISNESILRKVDGSTSSQVDEDTINKLHRSLSIYDRRDKKASWLWRRYTDKYNRFKLPTADDALSRGFGHVFFVKPSCNILKSESSLVDDLSGNQKFVYAFKNCPTLLNELSNVSGGHSFMLSLSNKVTGFSLNEEYISEVTHGKTYTGYQIAYGKNNIESMTVNNLSLEFSDDKFLHIYQLHKLWLEYISGVYRGTINPTDYNVINKILDYAGACYYILTAEDGESIIYWEKYYGLFPTNIDTSGLAWSAGQAVSFPKFSVTYRYSFRSMYDPYLFTEFNHNSNVQGGYSSYIPTFDKTALHTGQSFVGAPYIELDTGELGDMNNYTYKLRFKECWDAYDQ